jgi:aspartate carbamoyltransferase catalytic subunit
MDLTRNDILYILDKAEGMKTFCKEREKEKKERAHRTILQPLKNATLYSIFDEPSTRTEGSFEGAMILLGGEVKNKKLDSSSQAKGESLKETLKVLSSFPSTDIIILRHPSESAIKEVVETSFVPVINAGNGRDEHPTQALGDIFALRTRKGKLDGLEVAIAGDLKNGRTVHSLVYALANFDIKIKLISQEGLGLPPDVEQNIRKINPKIKIEKANSLDAATTSDAVYLLRLQKERLQTDQERSSYEASYPKITKEFLAKAKKDVILMSPGPKHEELPEWTDNLPNSAYWEGIQSCFYIRMALLNLILIKQEDYPS